MKFINIFLYTLIFCGYANAAVDEATLNTLPKYAICSNKKIKRMIRVDKGSNKDCVTFYSKGGADKNVGVSSTTSGCFKFFDNIQKNLTASGWKCAEIDANLVVIEN